MLNTLTLVTVYLKQERVADCAFDGGSLSKTLGVRGGFAQLFRGPTSCSRLSNLTICPLAWKAKGNEFRSFII